MTTSAFSTAIAPMSRALALVAIAAAADDADQLAGRERAQRIEHRRERLGLVRVVDDGEAAARVADDFEPALDALEVLQRGEHAPRGLACGDREPGGDQRVRSLVLAEQRQAHVEDAALVRDRHALRKALAHEAFELQALAGAADGQQTAGWLLARRRRRRRAARRIRVDDGRGSRAAAAR